MSMSESWEGSQADMDYKAKCYTSEKASTSTGDEIINLQKQVDEIKAVCVNLMNNSTKQGEQLLELLNLINSKKKFKPHKSYDEKMVRIE